MPHRGHEARGNRHVVGRCEGAGLVELQAQCSRAAAAAAAAPQDAICGAAAGPACQLPGFPVFSQPPSSCVSTFQKKSAHFSSTQFNQTTRMGGKKGRTRHHLSMPASVSWAPAQQRIQPQVVCSVQKQGAVRIEDRVCA